VEESSSSSSDLKLARGGSKDWEGAMAGIGKGLAKGGNAGGRERGGGDREGARAGTGMGIREEDKQ
jgi:hypothetical protein